MTSASIISSVRKVLINDAEILSYIKNSKRCILQATLKPKAKTPLLTLWLDDSTIISDLPAGNYVFEIGIWVSISVSSAQTKMLALKDRIKTLVNKNPDIINTQGFGAKVRTFDLVSAIKSDENIGALKLYYMPCIFDCIIGD